MTTPPMKEHHVTDHFEQIDPAQDYAEQVQAAAELQRAADLAQHIVGEALVSEPDQQAAIVSDAGAAYCLSYFAQTVLPAMIVHLQPFLGEDEAIEDVIVPVTATVIEHTAGGVIAAAMARQVMDANLATGPVVIPAEGDLG